MIENLFFDLDSLNITSVALLRCPFMPKQGPRSFKKKKIKNVTRTGGAIKDLGPCFGMNGHFRRDPDVISRLSKSTIDFLSFYIGFGS